MKTIKKRVFLQRFKCYKNTRHDTPEGTGISFLYELPAVSDKDYDPGSTPGEIPLGDINMDGTINLFDLVMCLNHVAQKTTIYGDAWIAADVNEDGNVNLFDLMSLLNYIAVSYEQNSVLYY